MKEFLTKIDVYDDIGILTPADDFLRDRFLFMLPCRTSCLIIAQRRYPRATLGEICTMAVRIKQSARMTSEEIERLSDDKPVVYKILDKQAIASTQSPLQLQRQ